MEYDVQQMISRIKEIKKQKGFSNDTLSAQSGIPKGTLSKILGSETKDPQISNIIKIANALGVSADYLVFGSGSSSESSFTATEISLVEDFRTLNDEGQEKVLTYVNDLIRTGIYKNPGQPGVVSKEA
jgi:transcriptional regulator with XRE-family HTH domain